MHSRIQRILKHLWLGTVPGHHSMAPDVARKLTQAVAKSEQRHSGEIRIYIETSLPMSYLWRKASTRQITRQRALTLFGKLRVWDTAHNNGVLIYLLLAEHAIEVVADRGLNASVEPQVWQAMVARMSAAFKAGDFEAGLSEALGQVSDLLAQHFPLAAGETNPNEMPDAPVLR
jgi:uncharacterized membrane protein